RNPAVRRDWQECQDGAAFHRRPHPRHRRQRRRPLGRRHVQDVPPCHRHAHRRGSLRGQARLRPLLPRRCQARPAPAATASAQRRAHGPGDQLQPGALQHELGQQRDEHCHLVRSVCHLVGLCRCQARHLRQLQDPPAGGSHRAGPLCARSGQQYYCGDGERRADAAEDGSQAADPAESDCHAAQVQVIHCRPALL
ncbi:hypothetical protein OC844_008072, partial [Tilletia horrida]